MAFNRLLPFDENETIKAGSAYLKRTMRLQELVLLSAEETMEREGENEFEDRKLVENAQPGSPAFVCYNI